MPTETYKYNATDEALVIWNKNFTSRIGDGSGDPEEEYFSILELLTACKANARYLDIGCGLGRLIKVIHGQVGTVVGLEPDQTRYFESYNDLHNGDQIQIFNSTSLQYKQENPGVCFDLISVSMVIQHVATNVCNQILNDVYDLLDSTGVALIGTTLQDQERFTKQSDLNPMTEAAFNAYANNSAEQTAGIPVHQFSKDSFLAALDKANLKVVRWGQFSYIRPEKLQWFANMFGFSAQSHADVGTSQYAVVSRKK